MGLAKQCNLAVLSPTFILSVWVDRGDLDTNRNSRAGGRSDNTRFKDMLTTQCTAHTVYSTVASFRIKLYVWGNTKEFVIKVTLENKNVDRCSLI